MSTIRLQGAQFALALMLALTLWTYVSYTTNPTQSKQIITPVRVSGPSPGLTLVNPDTGIPENGVSSVTITIFGPQKELADLSAQDFDAYIDLSGTGVGITSVPVQVDGPRPARTITPPEKSVALAHIVEATVPISITPRGDLPISYTVGTITPRFKQTVVRGPEPLVRKVVAAMAELNVRGHTTDFTEILSLTPVDRDEQAVEGVTLTQQQVPVRAQINTQFGVQQAPVVPELVGQPAPGYFIGGIEWEPRTVRILTSGELTSTFSTEPVNVSGITNTKTITVGVERLANAILQQPDVQITVRVTVDQINVKSQLPLQIPITPTGVGDGLDALAEPDFIELTLSGPLDRLRALATDAVTATVNLTGLGPGTHTLPVNVVVPEGLDLVGTSAPRVTITLVSVVPTPLPIPTPTSLPFTPFGLTTVPPAFDRTTTPSPENTATPSSEPTP